jgi:hypothetical protein
MEHKRKIVSEQRRHSLAELSERISPEILKKIEMVMGFTGTCATVSHILRLAVAIKQTNKQMFQFLHRFTYRSL